MAQRVIKDPDNTWYAYVDWSNWITDQQTKTGNTLTITGSSWTLPSNLVEESGTPTTTESNIAYLFGSGGTVDTDYSVVNTITYTLTHGAITKTGLTQDITFTIRIKEQ